MNRNSFLANMPPVTKNLLIITFVAWLADFALLRLGFDISSIFGLRYILSSEFHIWQPLTYMFMHADFSHIFFNMFAVLMFGVTLEQYWGSKRFLTYYLVTGIGAGIIQEIVWFCMYGNIPVPVNTIGASGAVYGILLAFGWLFPNTKMFIFPIPMPIRARTLVIIYILIELWSGFTVADNVAHFAHLGGILWGIGLILWWKKKGVDTGEGLWDTDKVKTWWHKIKSKVTQQQTTSDTHHTTYSNYHYQEPIREEKSEEEKKKEEEINRILDKIKLSGYDSLTDEEKQKLFKR